MTKAFEKIMAGLEEALARERGATLSHGKSHRRLPDGVHLLSREGQAELHRISERGKESAARFIKRSAE